jgi:hypothetical protein
MIYLPYLVFKRGDGNYHHLLPKGVHYSQLKYSCHIEIGPYLDEYDKYRGVGVLTGVMKRITRGL